MGQVRRLDHDRYLTTLFAGADERNDLLALYAFNLEIARAREMAQEPMMGRMRLQWWRDGIAEIYAGGELRHQVAHSLAAAIRRRRLSRSHFDKLIDAREADMDNSPPADLPSLVAYAESTSAPLGLLALEIMGGAELDAAARAVRLIWTAWALIGLLRAVPFHARQRRAYLPQSLMAGQGLAIDDLLHQRRRPELSAVVRVVATEARRQLQEGRDLSAAVPRRLLPALMPGALAASFVRRLESAGYDVFSSRVQEAPPGRILRLALVAVRGRI
jgi:phytoene synthase